VGDLMRADGWELRTIASLDLLEPHEPLSVRSDRWPQVLRNLGFQRLTGLAVAAWESGSLELTPAQADDLIDRHRGAMTVAIEIERLALRVTASLADAGVRAAVLKGTAIAHACYPDPTLRPFGDLDLLVSSADWTTADRVLRDRGLTRELPELRPHFTERFGKGITYTDPSGHQVDLHRTLVRGPFGLWLDGDELLASTEPFELGGRKLERLDRTGLLLNATLHAALGGSPPMLLPLRDIVQVSTDRGVDWDRLADWIVRWRLAAAVRYGFGLAVRMLRADLPPQAERIASMPVAASHLRLVRAYTSRRSEGGVGIAALRGIPGIGAKMAYAYALLVPSRDFRRAWASSRGDSLYRTRRTSVARMLRRVGRIR
jgi:hypothetical protein